CAGEQHPPDALMLRAVRILLRLAASMMLAVHGHPFPGDHAGRQPEPGPEEVADSRMQRQGSMGLMTMQKNRDARNRHMSQCERSRDVAPRRQRQQSVESHSNLVVIDHFRNAACTPRAARRRQSLIQAIPDSWALFADTAPKRQTFDQGYQ